MKMNDERLQRYYEAKRLREVEQKTLVQIGDELGISERSVRRLLAMKEPPQERIHRERKISLVEHEETIQKIINEYGENTSKIYVKLTEYGVKTSLRSVQRWMQENRGKKPRRVFNLLEFAPGEAAQTDFGSCHTIQFGSTERRLSVCVTVLCHSRLMYAEFIPCERMEHFLTCQRHAFEFFGGVPRKLIVDNCRCAVKRHHAGVVDWNPKFQAFCGHYRVKPIACTPRTPWAKGIVERMVGYIKNNVVGRRSFSCLEEANAVLSDWIASVANARVHKSTKAIPEKIFHEVEQSQLLALPVIPFPCELVECRVPDRYSRVAFDQNFYSIPSKCAQKVITLKATPKDVFLYDSDGLLIAHHPRCYDRNKFISSSDHIAQVRAQSSSAQKQNAKNDFLSLGKDAADFLHGLEENTLNVTSELLKLLTLRKTYGDNLFLRALHEAVHYQAFRAAYIEHLLLSPAVGRDISPLRIPLASDLMEIPTPIPDFNIYKVKKHE